MWTVKNSKSHNQSEYKIVVSEKFSEAAKVTLKKTLYLKINLIRKKISNTQNINQPHKKIKLFILALFFGVPIKRIYYPGNIAYHKQQNLFHGRFFLSATFCGLTKSLLRRFSDEMKDDS